MNWVLFMRNFVINLIGLSENSEALCKQLCEQGFFSPGVSVNVFRDKQIKGDNTQWVVWEEWT